MNDQGLMGVFYDESHIRLSVLWKASMRMLWLQGNVASIFRILSRGFQW